MANRFVTRGNARAKQDITKAMSALDKAIKKSVSITLEDYAPQYLEGVVRSQAAFNNYTGNLEDAYVAEVYRQRQLTNIYRHNVKRRGVIKFGKRGGRYVELSYERHKIRRMRRNVDYTGRGRSGEHKTEAAYEKAKGAIRYLKKYERAGGYRTSDRRRYNPLKGQRAAQNYIVVRNTAPYAAAVQYGDGRTKHYNVLRGAHIMQTRVRKELGELLQHTTNKELKAAGFKIK